MTALEHVWIPAERTGQIEVREYAHGDQARHTISISEADLKLPTLVGGFVARNPDNHADQWYIAREYFNKHYRLPAREAFTSNERTPGELSREIERKFVVAVMEADDAFEKAGATGTKTWVREFLLNRLEVHGLGIGMKDRLPPETTAKPARDADHCDFPDCEQHWTFVVAQLVDFMEQRCVGIEQSADAARWALIRRVRAAQKSGGEP